MFKIVKSKDIWRVWNSPHSR